MRKIVAAINMTLDGFSDHDALSPDAEVHQHYTDLLSQADAILYGRTTFELMEYWRPMVEKPSGDPAMDDFAVEMNRIQKIVFSSSLQRIDWASAHLATRPLEEEVLALKQQSGKDILVGSRSLILQLMELNLIDEYQICTHPVVVGSGRPLFENVIDRKTFRLTNTKIFKGGAIILYYAPEKE
ncbi:dihydrofolate reductase family protein [Flavilitoribacter nigricans]|uniref:Dihydrofolate reductase n=1 Tax=Flavilitoribacter nigricans (strain ATCC 23147 / DSM 23189 / NBRC 102662 / NCIMB 1420 / SS-2) TaxID=1122177 RepID=A0A2D0N293_FLAN2|nr:dihydrofolate reductase family protein [Flavilitoribacter nigricans]PHN02530.1 dihydrofolate reductase [Flavilitoribacter nigricans DSM 23189 = NBRC 102662]